jgi:uncharacterized protein YwgA
MNESSLELLSGIWNNIGSPNMEFFNDRLLLQKKVFLLQELGVKLGYRFNLYIHGPYSRDLATDGYRINTMVNSSKGKKEIVIDNSAFKKLADLEKNHKNDFLWFELLATITYLRNRLKKNKEYIKEYISDKKPYVFNLFEEGYNKLISEKLISS